MYKEARKMERREKEEKEKGPLYKKGGCGVIKAKLSDRKLLNKAKPKNKKNKESLKLGEEKKKGGKRYRKGVVFVATRLKRKGKTERKGGCEEGEG